MSEILKSYDSPRWTGEIMDCSLPVTLDTYSNCSFGCVYCFSQYQRGIGKGKECYNRKDVRCVNVERVKKLFDPGTKSSFQGYVSAKRPIQWGAFPTSSTATKKNMGKRSSCSDF